MTNSISTLGGGGIALQAANNRLATVNDAVAATGKTSTLPGNKCITVDEMNAMIGSGGGDREVPIDPLYDLMESGDIALRYIGIDKQGSGNYWEVESYITDASDGADITMDNTYFKILAIAERSS